MERDHGATEQANCNMQPTGNFPPLLVTVVEEPTAQAEQSHDDEGERTGPKVAADAPGQPDMQRQQTSDNGKCKGGGNAVCHEQPVLSGKPVQPQPVMNDEPGSSACCDHCQRAIGRPPLKSWQANAERLRSCRRHSRMTVARARLWMLAGREPRNATIFVSASACRQLFATTETLPGRPTRLWCLGFTMALAALPSLPRLEAK
mmetsp:Transcript_61796/g.146140  ORF Transcript_61796/g.146140 Transcript_61796/m.146140 type:complete len:204 (+) Transcript_61796:795-1406(+)